MITAPLSSPSSAPVSTEPVLAGNSAAVTRLRSQVERLGRYIRVALLTGDAGSGKSAVARALHAAGGSFGPFVLCQPESLHASKPAEAQRAILEVLASAGVERCCSRRSAASSRSCRLHC